MPEGMGYVPEDAYKGDYDSSAFDPDFQKELRAQTETMPVINTPDLVEMTKEETEEYEKKSAEPENQSQKLRPEIEETKQLMEIIIGQMKEKIATHEYGLIIGEDASGRVPAIMFHNFLSELYQKEDVAKPSRFFIGGVRNDNNQNWQRLYDVKKAVEAIVQKLLPEGKRVLLVTEFVETGSTLEPFARILGGMGVPFDIVSLGLQTDIANIDKLKLDVSGSLHYGNWESKNKFYFAKERYTPRVFHNPALSGVKVDKHSSKIYSKSIFDEEYRKKYEQLLENIRWNKKEFPDSIDLQAVKEIPYSEHRNAFLRVREDMKKASHQLAENFQNSELMDKE